MGSQKKIEAKSGQKMKTGLSIVELLIVVAILGILAAIVVPQFQSHTRQAREATAKESLQILRHLIEFYAAQHNDIPPGYPNGDVSQEPTLNWFLMQIGMATTASGEVAAIGTPGYPFGPYLKKLPENPFNHSEVITIVANTEEFPTEAAGTAGWIYQPATRTIRLDWPGTDLEGISYFNY